MLFSKSKKRPTATVAPGTKLFVKRGDTVVVIAGKDKGKTGTVKHVDPSKAQVIVEGLNLKKKAVKPNPMIGLQGGIVEQEAPLNISKVMLYNPATQKAVPRPQRKAISQGEGKVKRVRVDRKTGDQLDT
jgi:large subunit ribosomal protein L24